MKRSVFCLFAFVLTVSLYNLHAAQEEMSMQLSKDFEIFAQRYEAVFRERPIELIWDRGRPDRCCCDFCGGC